MRKLQSGKKDLDRFLSQKRGTFYYRRRVPTELLGLDDRSPQVRISLRTDDLAQARAIRDIHEKADDQLWGALLARADGDPWEKHKAAQRIARAMGFGYKPVEEVAAGPLEDVLRRVEVLKVNPITPHIADAILGVDELPKTTLKQAFKVYTDKIMPHEIAGKSEAQKTRWKNGKYRSVLHFIEVVGDISIEDITREHARLYYDHWMQRIAPAEGEPTHTADIGNRRFGDMSVLYKSYFSYMSKPDQDNPFAGLRFKNKGMKKRKRPSFSPEWVTGELLKPGSLAGLNDEARGIFLVAANTGARLSEIANLVADRIVINHPVPHIKIEPDESPEDRREIKTVSSIRVIPLVGMALDVMKRFPMGFPRYRDKGSSLSAAVNKYLDENGLLESDRHTFYSLRHSFEDRMKDAEVDTELRRILMGHSIDRPEYGEGGSLKLRQAAMQKVALPYDPSIV